ncbi:uncharacterized protein LOC108322526 [Vigna angularis]|uniref:uncharacterized protein LOC108322526 n=1 Tax=Phaseolus angularis TaxID=3914 RepID=UPI00080A2EDC|nr:uncharacterized protein LOC108322526 [Vigna angularis]
MNPSVDCLAVHEISDRPDWRINIKEIIKRQENGVHVRTIEAKKAARYLLIGEDLYKRGFSSPLLKCISSEEAEYVMRELHEGACGMHTGQRALRTKVIRAGYFWPMVEKDCKEFVQKCLKCQEHGRNLNLPPVELHSLIFGIPKVIVTDNGRQFIDKGLGEFYKKLGIKHVTSSVEHPQTNGQVEAVNKVIVSELKKRLGEAKALWVDELQEVL